MRWPKYWSFSFSISPSNEHPGLISFRMDRLDLLAVQGTLTSLLQHHTSKASILKTSKFQTVHHDPFEINFKAHNLAHNLALFNEKWNRTITNINTLFIEYCFVNFFLRYASACTRGLCNKQWYKMHVSMACSSNSNWKHWIRQPLKSHPGHCSYNCMNCISSVGLRIYLYLNFFSSLKSQFYDGNIEDFIWNFKKWRNWVGKGKLINLSFGLMLMRKASEFCFVFFFPQNKRALGNTKNIT